jgi:hypothetical protein
MQLILQKKLDRQHGDARQRPKQRHNH